jgi:predicted pyridoxine 5'-phosphate oxidase superfamily flavin-nucleotide-binding protein
MYQAKEVVSAASEIREVLGEVLYSQGTKCIDHIDKHCRKWIEHSTFVVVSTFNKAGQIDVAPKGDPSGSWKVLDQYTVAIPDRICGVRKNGLQWRACPPMGRRWLIMGN